MAINLVKGQRVEIGLSKLIVEMGWKVNPSAQPPYDLDASTFLLRANGEIGVEEDFVFYGSCKTIDTPDGKRPISNDGSVLGSVDDLGDDDDATGEGNEEIEVDLSKTSQLIDQIIFTAVSYTHLVVVSRDYNNNLYKVKTADGRTLTCLLYTSTCTALVRFRLTLCCKSVF